MCAKLQCSRSLRDKKACEPTGWLELKLVGEVAGQAGPIVGSRASIAALAGTIWVQAISFLDRELSWCLWIDLARL